MAARTVACACAGVLSAADLNAVIRVTAKLTAADLHTAIATHELRLTCRTLRGATLPDGTKVPDDQDFPAGWKQGDGQRVAE